LRDIPYINESESLAVYLETFRDSIAETKQRRMVSVDDSQQRQEPIWNQDWRGSLEWKEEDK
jgi:hypothetical protein